MWRGVINARHATFWSVTHPSLETISCILQCIIKYVRKESYEHWYTIFFDTGKLVEGEKKWHGPYQYGGAASSSQTLAVMTQAHKKPAGIATRLIEMRITRKNGTNRSWRGDRNERAARDVLLIGLCTQALFTRPSSLWERQKEWKRKKREREGGRERRKW